ncbi:MAG: hypothetical protein R2746_03420 [Acidimicrobiales bacterium]
MELPTSERSHCTVGVGVPVAAAAKVTSLPGEATPEVGDVVTQGDSATSGVIGTVMVPREFLTSTL